MAHAAAAAGLHRLRGVRHGLLLRRGVLLHRLRRVSGLLRRVVGLLVAAGRIQVQVWLHVAYIHHLCSPTGVSRPVSTARDEV